MEFINKGFLSSIIYFFIIMLGIYFFFNFLPIIILIALAIWGIYKVTNLFRNRKGKDTIDESIVHNEVESNVKDKYDKTNAIDVDFTEIK